MTVEIEARSTLEADDQSDQGPWLLVRGHPSHHGSNLLFLYAGISARTRNATEPGYRLTLCFNVMRSGCLAPEYHFLDTTIEFDTAGKADLSERAIEDRTISLLSEDDQTHQFIVEDLTTNGARITLRYPDEDKETP